MTPLAYFITKQLTVPVKHRRFNDGCALLKNMGDVHCFECSDVVDAANSILSDMGRHGDMGSAIVSMTTETSFLPAPKTWIEFCTNGYRLGFLLVSDEQNQRATVSHAAAKIGKTDAAISISGSMKMPLMNGATMSVVHMDMLDIEQEQQYQWILLLTVLLAFINTPRIIGRTQHMPHRGLERRLLAQRGIIGKFPLNAWTEIKLEVHAPKDLANDDSIEAHLTGNRALHFCRAHLRLRLGRLEIVRAHWRGDGSLGIKQSRYRLLRRDAH